MNYAIQFESLHTEYLQVTPRKKTLKASLIQVIDGLLLLKLGKFEYTVEANQFIWLPFDCLSSLTFFPNTKIHRVEFSVRLHADFPNQAGYIKPNSLVKATLERLARDNATTYYQRQIDTQECSQEKQFFSHLLAILKHEAQHFTPKLTLNSLSVSISNWPEEAQTLTPEYQMILQIREALKQHQSGVTLTKTINELFAGDTEHFTLLYKLILGQPLPLS